jgi:DMSO reductase anchor subunit
MLENPIILAALICFLLGLVLSGLARVVPASTIASAVLPIIFLASYIITYQQVPSFPPIGSTNKIFYIALVAALVGLALDLLPRTANYRKLLAVVMPLVIVGWIGFPRFAALDVELMATVLGLWLGGTALLWRLETVATTPAERQHRRHRDADGTPPRVRADRISRRFFDQLNAMPRSGCWTCRRRALGTCRSARRL